MRTALFTLFTLLFVRIIAAQPATPLIALVEEGNIYLWQDGTRRVLLDTGSVERVWLKLDGSRIVFIQDDGRVQKPGYDDLDIADYQYQSTSLWAIDSDGENLLQLADLDDYRAGFDYGSSVLIHNLEWVPGTSLIAFNTFDRSEVAGFSNTHANLYTVDTETGDSVLAHTTDERGVFTISPDGEHAAIATDTAISIIALDGRMVLPDVYSFERSADTAHNYYYPDVRWAADGDSLVAVDLTSRVGWTEDDADGNPVYPAVDLVQIHMDGTTEIRATEENDDFNYWTLRFVADGEQAIYSTGDSEGCDFVAFTLADDIQLVPGSQNTVTCYRSDAYAFLALTPGGHAYRLEQRDGVATLSRACEDFSACDIVQTIDGQVRSLDFIDESHYVYRVVVEDGADIFNERRDLFYAALDEEPQHIGTTLSRFPDNVFSVSPG